MRKDLFISVDVEADGPYPFDYSMLSVGSYTMIDGVDYSFYTELCPVSANFIPKAVEVVARGGLEREQLFETGADPKVAMTDLTEWVVELCGATHRPVFVGFNASFDWKFVDAYMHRYLQANVFGISALDIKSYYMGKCNREMWTHTTKRNIPKKFFGPQPHTHNALSDAIEQYQLFMNIHQGVS